MLPYGLVETLHYQSKPCKHDIHTLFAITQTAEPGKDNQINIKLVSYEHNTSTVFAIITFRQRRGGLAADFPAETETIPTYSRRQ